MSSLFIGILSKVIMTIQTWVAWNQNRTLTYALPILFIFFWVGSFATVGIFVRGLPCQYSVLIFLISGYLLYFLYYFLVEPMPAGIPDIGCIPTLYNPTAMRLSLAFLLLYDTGAIVISRTTQSRMCSTVVYNLK